MNIFKKHWLFLLITSVVLIILQYTPYLYHRFQTPPDRVYLGAERYTPDYYVYLFYTNQGAMGRTSVLDYYTNASHDGSLVHIEYLLAGKIGKLLGLSLPATFYLFRTFTLIFYILVSFWFIGLFFKETANPVILGLDPRIHINNYRIDSRLRGNDKENKPYFFSNSLLHKLTFLLSWFWGGVFWPQFSSSGLTFKSYFDFYQPPDLINRLTYEPHKFIGMSLFLIILSVIARSVYAVSKTTKQSSSKIEIATPLAMLGARNDNKRKTLILTTRYYILLPLLLLAGFIHGVTAINLIFTIGFYLLFMFIIDVLNKKSFLSFLSQMPPIFLTVILLSLPLLYWQLIFTKNPVWYAVSLWERHFAQVDSVAPLLPTITGYLFILGPLIFLGLIGLGKFLKDHKKIGLLLFSFLLSNLFLFFIGYIFLGTTKHRYYQEPYLIGWSILAMYGILRLLNNKSISRLCNFFSFAFASEKKFNKSTTIISREYSGTKKIAQTTNMCTVILISTLLLLGLPNFKHGLDTQLYQFGTPPNLDAWGYPPVNWYQGLLWMQKNTNTDAVILSLPTAGEIIPAIPGRRVVVGDYVHTYHYFDKLPVVTTFFKGDMTTDEAKNFLSKEKVNFVFSGFEEQNTGNLDNYKNLLHPVFKNNDVAVYKVRP